LILTPTRELAQQVESSLQELGRFAKLRSCTIFGGVSQRGQEDALRRGVDIVVATPGRLLDLLEQKVVSLSSIEMLVLDEADRMMDMGFLPDVTPHSATRSRSASDPVVFCHAATRDSRADENAPT
jgi:ATP-dependent RNA helicase RhlE